MPDLLLNTFRTAHLQTDGLYFSNCKFKVKKLKLFIYVTSWDEIIHMSQFFLMEFNKTNFLGTSSAPNWRKPED